MTASVDDGEFAGCFSRRDDRVRVYLRPVSNRRLVAESQEREVRTAKQVEEPDGRSIRLLARRIGGAVACANAAGRGAIIAGQRTFAIRDPELKRLCSSLLDGLGVHGNLSMQLGGYPKHPRRDRKTFGFVRIEQALGGAVQHHREFPAEIVGVLDARVHALAAGGRVNMRGVAGQEDAADSILVHHADVGAKK